MLPMTISQPCLDISLNMKDFLLKAFPESQVVSYGLPFQAEVVAWNIYKVTVSCRSTETCLTIWEKKEAIWGLIVINNGDGDTHLKQDATLPPPSDEIIENIRKALIG